MLCKVQGSSYIYCMLYTVIVDNRCSVFGLKRAFFGQILWFSMFGILYGEQNLSLSIIIITSPWEHNSELPFTFQIFNSAREVVWGLKLWRVEQGRVGSSTARLLIHSIFDLKSPVSRLTTKHMSKHLYVYTIDYGTYMY